MSNSELLKMKERLHLDLEPYIEKEVTGSRWNRVSLSRYRFSDFRIKQQAGLYNEFVFFV